MLIVPEITWENEMDILFLFTDIAWHLKGAYMALRFSKNISLEFYIFYKERILYSVRVLFSFIKCRN